MKAQTKSDAGMTANLIPLNKISTSKSNPRRHFNSGELNELVHSIKALGVLQPVIVRPRGKDRFELVSGERRVRASHLAGKTTVPAVVRDLSDAQVLEIQLVENIQRAEMSLLDEAAAFARLKSELGYTLEEIALRTGKSRAHVGFMLQVTELPAETKEAFTAGRISRAVTFHIAQMPADTRLAATVELLKPEWSDKPLSLNAAKSITTRMRKRMASPRRTSGFQKAGAAGMLKAAAKKDFQANWVKFLVRFNTHQFIAWRTIVNGRTDLKTISEAVEVVMLEEKRTA